MKSSRKLDAIKAWITTDGLCWFCGEKMTLESDGSPSMFTLILSEKGPIGSCASCTRTKKAKNIEEFREYLKQWNKKVVFYGEIITDRVDL